MSETARKKAPDPEGIIREYIHTGDTVLRDRIVETHLYIASLVARRFSGRGVDYDDLYQVASMALFKALERYDPDRGVKFSSFVTPTMIGEVKNYFRDRARVIRLPRNSGDMIREMEKAIETLSQKLFRQPTAMELAEYLEIDVERVLEALELRGAARPASLDYSSENEDSDAPLSAYLGFEEKGYTDFEKNDALHRAMEKLSAQQRGIIKARFYDGMSQRDVAQTMGISQMTVSRAERRALNIMKMAMEKSEE